MSSVCLEFKGSNKGTMTNQICTVAFSGNSLPKPTRRESDKDRSRRSTEKKTKKENNYEKFSTFNPWI